MDIEGLKKLRIRLFAASLALSGERSEKEGWPANINICTEAADVIERLQRELEEARKDAERFTAEDLDLLRQWYNAVADISPKYLDDADHALMAKVKDAAREKQ